jgi:hypothetical protein
LKYLNQMWKALSVHIQDQPTEKVFGMEVVTLKTPFGKLHFHSHPRFNENPRTRNSMLMVDFGHLQYVKMKDRDTNFMKKVQPKKADYREDMFLTECGLKAHFPESMMYISNINGYSP